MEAPSRLLHRQSRRSRCCYLSIISAAVIVALLVLIVPLATILPNRRRSHGLPSSILLPLYIYPVPGAWDPLFKVLDAHPSLNFTIIINPADGPGSSASPSDDYLTEVQNLTKFDNVKTIGYVRTHWATRNLTEVLNEVAIYSAWSEINSTTDRRNPMGMHGIFFDETPSEFSQEAAKYLTTINQAVKNAPGLLSGKTTVHNPGTIPDPYLNDASTDITVSFESDLQDYNDIPAKLASLPLERSRYSFMVNSAPSSHGSLRKLVESMSMHSEHLFATDLSEDYYETFGSNWNDFVSVVPT